MDRSINPEIAARTSSKVNTEIAKARRKIQPAEEPAETADASAVKLGISDTAAAREVRVGIADRLADVEGVSITTGDAGTGGGDSAGDLASFVGVQPTGADAAIAQAEADLAGRFEVPSLTDGPERVDPETAIAAAKAGLPGSGLRESANSMLFEEAANDTTPAGIAEQGTGAVSDSIFTKQGRIDFMKSLVGGPQEGTAGARPTDGGVEATLPAVDLAATDPALLKSARIIQSNLIRGDEMTKELVRITPDGTRIYETNAGVRTAEMTNGKVVRIDPNEKTTTVTEADGATTKLLPSGDVEETPPKPPSQPGVGIPDPEGGDDRFRFISEGLKGRLGPQGVEGGGDIDFGDDIPFGVGAGAQIVDQQGVLLGDAGRAGAVAAGPATSGFQGFDVVRNSGAVDFEDESPLGGGLEDDPLAETGPSQNLDGGLVVTEEEKTDETETADTSDTSDSTDGTP